MTQLRRALFLSLFVSSMAGAQGQPATPTDPAALSDHTKLLDPIQVDSLTVTPIESTRDVADASVKQLLTLDEAMPKQLVTIREKPDKEVNALVLTNRGNQPLFVMSGEVIIGGEQDRIIGRNTIVPPHTTQDIPVFCVEHGRWSGSNKAFTTAKALAHGRLRGKASFDGQSDVWAEVATKNELRNTKSSTDTYRKIASQQSDGTLATLQQRVDGALAKLPAADRAKLVGFAVSLNGKVATVDVFNSPQLFGKLETKLLRSYLTEAIDVKADAHIKPPTATDIKAFVSEVDAAPPAPSYATASADTEVYTGKTAAKARVMYKASPSPAPATGAPPAQHTKAADDADDVFDSYQAE